VILAAAIVMMTVFWAAVPTFQRYLLPPQVDHNDNQAPLKRG
jgi:hypothetical protein